MGKESNQTFNPGYLGKECFVDRSTEVRNIRWFGGGMRKDGVGVMGSWIFFFFFGPHELSC